MLQQNIPLSHYTYNYTDLGHSCCALLLEVVLLRSGQKLSLYLALVRSHLDNYDKFCGNLYYRQDIDALQSVQKRMTKIYLRT